MRGARVGPFAAGLALLLAACGSSTAGPAPSTGAPIVFGAAVSLTGSQSKEGGLTRQGYDLWLDWINARGGILLNNVKHPVQIIYEDDQSNANLSATLVQKLITSEKAQFILGPYGSAATATDAIIAEKNGIPMVESNGAAQSIFNKGYKYTFGVLSPANKYLTGVIDMAATLTPKPTTIAMLNANDNFSLEVGKAVRGSQSPDTVGVPFQLHQRVTHGSAPKLTGTIVLQRAPTTGAGWRVTAVDVGREVGKVPSQGGPPPSRAPLSLWIGTLAIGLVIVVGGSALIRWAGRGSVTGSSASPDPAVG